MNKVVALFFGLAIIMPVLNIAGAAQSSKQSCVFKNDHIIIRRNFFVPSERGESFAQEKINILALDYLSQQTFE